MKRDTIIRRATLADFAGVTGILAEENRFHARLVPHVIRIAEPVMTRDWFEGVLADPAQALFVAQFGEEIAGVLLAALRASADDPILQPRRYAYVDEVAVAAGNQGQGLGRALMAQAERWALAGGACEIELHVWEANRGAIAFYERLGYSTTRRTMRHVLGPAP
jgi:ribosomal protein S18 acetylase RimI-like enzyme